MILKIFAWWQTSRRLTRVAKNVAGSDYHKNRRAIKRQVRLRTRLICRGFDDKAQVFLLTWDIAQICEGKTP